VQGLVELAHTAGVAPTRRSPWLAAAVDFVLEGLYAQKKISRSDERGYHAAPSRRARPSPSAPPGTTDRRRRRRALPDQRGKKKYYN
jgi:hypothetical protein